MANSHRRPTPSRYPSSRGSYRLMLVCVVAAVAGGYGVVRLALPPPEATPAASQATSTPAHHASATPPKPATLAPSKQRKASPASTGTDAAAQWVAERRWLAVLERLDKARERAWRLGRVALLRQVWTATSSGLDADRRMLRSWAGRGLRVAGVSMTFERVQVVRHRPGSALLRCVDRLDPLVVPTGRRLLTDRPTRHRITLVRTDEGWRLSEVRALR